MDNLEKKIITEYIRLHAMAFEDGGTLADWEAIQKQNGHGIDTEREDFIIYTTLEIAKELLNRNYPSAD